MPTRSPMRRTGAARFQAGCSTESHVPWSTTELAPIAIWCAPYIQAGLCTIAAAPNEWKRRRRYGSRARNRGARAARADRFAFIDADCVATPGWLEAMRGCAGRAPLLAGAVRVTTEEPPNAIERFEVLWRFDQESWVKLGWAATAN